jgi:hypothetical protein
VPLQPGDVDLGLCLAPLTREQLEFLLIKVPQACSRSVSVRSFDCAAGCARCDGRRHDRGGAADGRRECLASDAALRCAAQECHRPTDSGEVRIATQNLFGIEAT